MQWEFYKVTYFDKLHFAHVCRGNKWKGTSYDDDDVEDEHLIDLEGHKGRVNQMIPNGNSM